uniref:TPPP family protein n=1 Tax=Syphacia muris TaxID=451379 RepID=A0A0N5AHU6_9BILA
MKWEGFVKFGSQSATEMTGKNFDKWLKDAGVIDGKTITTTMTGIAFSKVTGLVSMKQVLTKKKATFPEVKKVIIAVAEDRARTSKKPPQEELDAIVEKLSQVEAPSLNTTSKTSAEGVYSRLTDHTKYTGAHKERFDADGKGRGKAGREEIKDDSGYVAAYKNRGTYDKIHGKQ